MRFSKVAIVGLVVLSVFASFADAPEEEQTAPTYADAAVILAKYSGLFDRYVPKDADLSYCVSFLNKHGVYFGLMEVVNGMDFTVKDCARVMGQVDLILSGEAEYLTGKVILPKGIASWEDLCTMNGVMYKEGHKAIILASQKSR